MKKYFLYSVLVLLFGCKKATFNIDNLNGNRIDVIGHGGSGFHGLSNPYPNDSYSGIIRGVYGFHADGAEVDVQMSNDSVLFLFHDPTLERSTNYAGCLFQFDSVTLANCEYKNTYSNVKDYLITLERILIEFQSTTQKPLLFLDVRTYVSCTNIVSDQDVYEFAMAEKINNLINKYNYTDKIFVEAGSWEFLSKMNALNPSLRLLYDGKIDQPTIQLALAGNLFGLVSYNDETTKEDVMMAHQNNLRVVLFDVKSLQSQLETVVKNPDYIQTDRIILLQRILD